MTITKNEILDILKMPKQDFIAEMIMPAAKKAYLEAEGDRLLVTAILGYDNICKNQCLYCGMRAGNSLLPRYRMSPDDVIALARHANEQGFHRIFLISGEDPNYGFENLLRMVSGIKKLGMHMSLACGEFPEETCYLELKDAGADEYVMKFEMSDEETFNLLNPSTNFKKRMACIEMIQKCGLKLASGNIVGFPGQTPGQLADDILLMKKLDISWAPIIPYMPAANTPLAKEGGRGDLLTNLKEIAILRLMMPHIRITAQQPGEDIKNGLADEKGNLNAIDAGANILFYDLLPDQKAKDFRVIDDRNVTGTAHLYRIAELSGMTLDR